MQYRCVVAVTVVRKHVATRREIQQVLVDATQTYTILLQKILTDMMHSLRFCGNSKLTFRQDIPITLVQNRPVVRVHLYQRQLNDVLFLNVETRSLRIKTN